MIACAASTLGMLVSPIALRSLYARLDDTAMTTAVAQVTISSASTSPVKRPRSVVKLCQSRSTRLRGGVLPPTCGPFGVVERMDSMNGAGAERCVISDGPHNPIAARRGRFTGGHRSSPGTPPPIYRARLPHHPSCPLLHLTPTKPSSKALMLPTKPSSSSPILVPYPNA